MSMQDPFLNSAFSMVEMTAAINVLPNQYGRLNALNLFPVKGVSTRQILVDERNGTLNLIKTASVGAPGQVNRAAGRKARTFSIPHLPLDDFILPADIQGIRAFGSQTGTDVVATKVNEKLQEMKNKHAQTLEWHRFGALKGLILDSDSSVIYDLYAEFGVTQKVIDFALGTAGTDVGSICRSVSRHIETHLFGETSNGTDVQVSPEFFDRLSTHNSVKAAFANWQAAQNRLGGDMRSGFSFGGLNFIEYNASVSDADGNIRRFIEAGEGHAYPTGTVSTFATIVAPADFNETVNTIGQEFYAKSQPRDFGRGMDIHTQSNPLPLCYRPAVLVKCFTSN